MTVDIYKNMLHLVCDGCGKEQDDGTSEGEIPGESFRGWTWWDAPETPEDIFRAVTYCPRCAPYIRTREDGSKYDIREEEEEDERPLSDPEARFKWTWDLLKSLPEELVQDLEEEYGTAFWILENTVQNVKEQDLNIGYQRGVLRIVVRQLECILERTDAKILAQAREKGVLPTQGGRRE